MSRRHRAATRRAPVRIVAALNQRHWRITDPTTASGLGLDGTSPVTIAMPITTMYELEEAGEGYNVLCMPSYHLITPPSPASPASTPTLPLRSSLVERHRSFLKHLLVLSFDSICRQHGQTLRHERVSRAYSGRSSRTARSSSFCRGCCR
jgi:hypothetical protein